MTSPQNVSPGLTRARASSSPSTASAATSQATIARIALAEALDHLETMQRRGVEVTEQVDQLVRLHGASVRFVHGTNVFRCCGVTGTCTADKGARLLASWARIAERNLGTGWPKQTSSPSPDPLTLSLSKGAPSPVSPGLTRAKAHLVPTANGRANGCQNG